MKQKLTNDTPYRTKEEFEHNIEAIFRKYDEKAREYRDQILNKIDQTMEILAQMREDNIAYKKSSFSS